MPLSQRLLIGGVLLALVGAFHLHHELQFLLGGVQTEAVVQGNFQGPPGPVGSAMITFKDRDDVSHTRPIAVPKGQDFKPDQKIMIRYVPPDIQDIRLIADSSIKAPLILMSVSIMLIVLGFYFMVRERRRGGAGA
ncbi:MAG: hypothetical protein HY291_08595 [Planctomycetes bacterium]|nr:hypothetical protein [Planctomycetota bacterium]